MPRCRFSCRRFSLRRFSCRKHGEVSGYLPVGLPEAEPEQPA